MKKRSHGGFPRKKEGEANVVTEGAHPEYQFPMVPMSYYPYLYIAATQYQQSTCQYQPQKGNIVPRELPTASPPFHRNHNHNASCAFRAGYIGHSTEDSWALKKRIQELIDQEILSFSEENPNVKTDPLQNHGGSVVNVVVEEEANESVLRVDDVKTQLSVILKRLEQFGFLVGIHDDCAVCEYDPDNCDELRGYNTKAVPWNYETTTYLGGKEICIPDTEIVNIAGAGGMTCSGCVFSPKYTPRVSPSPIIIPSKEKFIPTPTPQAGATVPATPNMTIVPVPTNVIDNKAAESEVSKGKGSMVENKQVEDHKKSITFEESQEFLKLIKKSDFKIVDQLNQTPSKISILCLLLTSEAHRKALLKVLNATHVMQDITVDQFDNVVANITSSRYLGFNEVELPPKFKGPEMRTITLIVRAFDGPRRQVIREVDLPICVGPHHFSITFPVMDINPAYSCLLGRPWIHAAGAVTSTLHQRLKFLIDDKLVIVCGEEDLLVSGLSSFIYFETDEGIVEIPLHYLEFEEVSSATANNDQSSAIILSSVRSAKQTSEKGPLSGWGKVVDVAEKRDIFGIGYHPATRKASPKKKQFNPVKFSSADFQNDHNVAVIGESSDSKPETPNVIRRCPPGFKLPNWTATMIPIVYLEKT
ncbi:uncharacterized protein LOC127094585 [Lathyrus oleraceus]|uniref:uncharacterized protein LOC127094585 n=1 Tax=Pisum sativum TaxID=3888 RepID=UPI0021D227C8|nr:uncharacterized protein LOC127094585 [Pisum sativum]